MKGLAEDGKGVGEMVVEEEVKKPQLIWESMDG